MVGTGHDVNFTNVPLLGGTHSRNCQRYKAIHAAIGIVKDFAEKEYTMPLNVAMEMRFTKHSTSPMSPAYGREVKFQWIINFVRKLFEG